MENDKDGRAALAFLEACRPLREALAIGRAKLRAIERELLPAIEAEQKREAEVERLREAWGEQRKRCDAWMCSTARARCSRHAPDRSEQ